MLGLEILKLTTFLVSILGVIISAIFWLKIKRLSIYIPYALLTFFYIFISVFEPNDLPPYVKYTDTFYLFEIITSSILIIGIFYYQANLNINISIFNRYIRLFPFILLFSFFICIDSIIPLCTLFILSISNLCVIKKLDFRFVCRVITKKTFYLEIILLLLVISYFISGNLLDKIGFAIATFGDKTAIFQYRTEVYNGEFKSIIDNILQFFSLSFVPFFGIYYFLISVEHRTNKKLLRAIVFLITGGIVAFSTLGKARITYYIAGFVLSSTYHYLSFRKKSFFNILILFFPFLVGFSLIQFMYFFTSGIDASNNFYSEFFARLLQVPVQSNAAYFELFPSTEAFQLTGNGLTRSIILLPILELLGIDISPIPIEAVVSYRLTREYFGYVSSGFATAYSQWGLISPLITAMFIVITIQIDAMLHCITNNRRIYSLYCYLIAMMPVTVTVSYSSAVGLFGMWVLPLLFIFLYFLEY